MAPPASKQPSRDEVIAREKRRTAAIRMQLTVNHPFWGYLLIETELIPAVELPSLAATDCERRIWYNPTLTQYLTLDELGFVMAHEVGHIVLQNLERRRGRKASVWNAACDYAVNRIVAAITDPADGLPLYTPPVKFLPTVGRIAPLLNPDFDELTTEAIYEELRENPMWDDSEHLVEVDLSFGEAGPVRLDRRPESYDIHVPADQAGGDARSGGNGSGAQDSPVSGPVARAFQYAERCDSPGYIPGDLRRLMGSQMAGVREETWQAAFRRIVESSLGRDEYTLARPHRRWLDQGFIVPGLRRDPMPSVVISLDTSGTMSPRHIAEVCAEIRPVLARCGDAVLLVHDAVIQEVVRGNQAILAWLEAGWTRGGGGTDHCPVFDWIARAAIDPDLYVGLTDCASLYPEVPPAYPVVWVTPRASNYGIAPWGTRLWADPF